MDMEAKKMTYIHKHLAAWPPDRLTPKIKVRWPQTHDRLTIHDHLTNILLYIYLYTSDGQIAKEIVCSCVFIKSQMANLKKTWPPSIVFGHLRSNKRSRKEVCLLPLNGSNIASQTPGGAVSHKDE